MPQSILMSASPHDVRFSEDAFAIPDQFRRSAGFVDKTLRGMKPVEHPSTDERKQGTHFSLAADPSHSVRKAAKPWSQNFRWPVLEDSEAEAFTLDQEFCQ
jgi:hypothetical protein